MQIRRVIVYGRNGGHREVEFRIGKLNIVSGDAKSGKSAILEIIDYCLGASKCLIPDGAVRNGSSHYAVILTDESGEIFICRRDPPANQDASEAIWVLLGRSVDVPPISEFESNFNRASLRALLTTRLGIGENETEREEWQTKRAYAANFRHALMYCLQNQNEVDQKAFLFHNTGDRDRFQAVQDTLPYFLGSQNGDRPRIRAQIREAMRELRLAERRLEEQSLIAGQGLARAQSLVREAVQVGLLPESLESGSSEAIAQNLDFAMRQYRDRSALPDLPSDILGQLDARQDEAMSRVTEIDRQLRAVQEIEHTGHDYNSEVRRQERRLQAIQLFRNSQGNQICPVCGTECDQSVNSEEAAKLANRLQTELEGAEASRPRLEAVRDSLRRERNVVAGSLRDIRESRAQLMAQQDELRRVADLREVQAQFVGRASLYLESGALNTSDNREQLQKEIAYAESNVKSLREQLGEVGGDRFESAVSIISRDMTQMAGLIDFEYKDDFIRFDPRGLTVIADTRTGPVPMERMGSGENWMSCHVMSHLAIHKWFATEERPVPRFMVFDQLSQVWFPTQGDLTGGDWNSVERLYKLIEDQLNELDGKLQFIALEHVVLDRDWFQDAMVVDWHNGEKLIPKEWLVGQPESLEESVSPLAEPE